MSIFITPFKKKIRFSIQVQCYSNAVHSSALRILHIEASIGRTLQFRFRESYYLIHILKFKELYRGHKVLVNLKN